MSTDREEHLHLERQRIAAMADRGYRTTGIMSLEATRLLPDAARHEPRRPG